MRITRVAGEFGSFAPNRLERSFETNRPRISEAAVQSGNTPLSSVEAPSVDHEFPSASKRHRLIQD